MLGNIKLNPGKTKHAVPQCHVADYPIVPVLEIYKTSLGLSHYKVLGVGGYKKLFQPPLDTCSQGHGSIGFNPALQQISILLTIRICTVICSAPTYKLF